MYASSLCSIKSIVCIVKNDALSPQNTSSPSADPGVWPFECFVSCPVMVISDTGVLLSKCTVLESILILGCRLRPECCPLRWTKVRDCSSSIDVRKWRADSEGSSYREENSDQTLNVPGHLFWWRGNSYPRALRYVRVKYQPLWKRAILHRQCSPEQQLIKADDF